MHHTLSDTQTRRWLTGVALLAGLAALIVSLSAGAAAQDQPVPPAWFYGDDADSYAGAQVKAFNQNGVELHAGEGDFAEVDSEGRWSRQIFRSDAIMVTFRIVHSSGTLESSPLDVVDGDLIEVSITEFRRVTAASATKPIQIIARLHPTRTYRTVEFNIRINGVDADPAPRARYMSPREATNRWLESSLIDAGDGFRVQVIACKRDNDSLVFGLRVEGHDDILPRQRLFRSSIEDNRWKNSNPIDVPLPGRQGEGFELSRDEGCTGGQLAR